MPRPTKVSTEMFLPARRRAPRSRVSGGVEHDAVLQILWEVVGMIPHGKVSTYGAVARAAGLPRRARLTGFALKVAPDAMNLPWHRVVGAGGRIVFPKNSAQYREQARRLRGERVQVKDGRVAPEHLTDLDDR